MNAQTILVRTVHTGVIAVLAAGVSLMAGEPSLVRTGISLNLPIPTGDISKGCETGFGGAVLVEWGFTDHMALRGRAEWNPFGDKTEDENTLRETKNGARAIVVMADYIVQFSSHEKGLYIFGGVGGVYGTTTEELYASEKTSKSAFNFGYTAGVGYNFNATFGLEAQYVVASEVVKPEGADKGLDFTWVQVSLRWRF